MIEKELWVLDHTTGKKFNLSDPKDAREWLGKNMLPGKIVDEVALNTGKKYSLKECPDHLIFEFCQYIANQMGNVTEAGPVN